MPDLNWNIGLWDGSYDWSSEGEEWSYWWGGSEAQWFGVIYPRIHRFFPAKRVLEIAPGFGRWTRFLIPGCNKYIGIDLSGQAIQACNEHFGHVSHVGFFQNDGLHLDAASNGAFDFIFSFDSLVHAEIDVLEKYIPQLINKLSMTGVAFIHHSNFHAIDDNIENPHSRAMTVSGKKFANLVEANGGKVLIQEFVNWGGPDLIDCFTLFGKLEHYGQTETVLRHNNDWVNEMNIVRENQSHYSKIAVDDADLCYSGIPRESRILRIVNKLRKFLNR